MNITPNPLLLSSFLFVAFFSCNQPVKENSTATRTPIGAQVKTDSTLSIDTLGCVRGEAIPVIDTAVFHNTQFQLQSDHLTGIETVQFDNGDQLTIHNHGCEYYVLTFRFETSRFSEDTLNTSYWFPVALALMKQVQSGLKAPVNIESGIHKLKSYIDSTSTPQLNEELDYSESEIRNYLVLEKIQKVQANRFALELSYVVGPL